MPRFLLSALAFIVLALAHIVFGRILVMQLVGAIFLLLAVGGLVEREIGFETGVLAGLKLSGWGKAFVLVPIAAAGMILVAYASDITCSQSRYKNKPECALQQPSTRKTP